MTNKTKSGLRIYDRVHACYFCGTLTSKLSRHLFRHHFFHNTKVLKAGHGSMIIYRQSKGLHKPDDYIPCEFCLGFIYAGDINRHCKRCVHRKIEGDEHHINIQNQCELLLYPPKKPVGGSIELQESVVQPMNNDNELIKSDELILTYGSFIVSGKGVKESSNISQKMRILARLVLEIRRNASMKDFSLLDCLTPAFFDDVVEATKRLAGFTNTNNDGEKVPAFNKPSLALKLGYALENCAMLLQGLGLRKGDDTIVVKAQKFQKIFQSEWSVRISSASLRSLADNRFNKDDILPLTSDLLLLKSYCDKRLQEVLKEIKITPSRDLWRELADIILTRVTVFNKRRGNEPSSILLSRYTSRNSRSNVVHGDILETLSTLEKKLMNR
ncbi:uncharacterized protein LOC130640517 [Hydractinia symbiolongicarpus]|uniref:uncharacterized protein LOC130640517 n=1 Tax=Hydractinia symbiolongicarpus TaxID=13093 RepID=UPI00255147ED|nr:uncharacterized protein LOC130640517 [Hydractinia symbiolongicarpus]